MTGVSGTFPPPPFRTRVIHGILGQTWWDVGYNAVSRILSEGEGAGQDVGEVHFPPHTTMASVKVEVANTLCP